MRTGGACMPLTGLVRVLQAVCPCMGRQLEVLALESLLQLGMVVLLLALACTAACSRVALPAPTPEVPEGPKQAGPLCCISSMLAGVLTAHGSK